MTVSLPDKSFEIATTDFGKPRISRTLEYMKRTKPYDISNEKEAILENNQAKCKECQIISPNP